MDDFRSKSCNNEGLENTYNYYSSNFGDNNGVAPNYKTSSNPSGMQDLRCYSASYASSCAQNNGPMDIVVAGGGEQWKFKKGKSTNGMGSKNWSLNDPELLRKKRVASYKAYTVEGKLKGSIKKSFRWIKESSFFSVCAPTPAPATKTKKKTETETNDSLIILLGMLYLNVEMKPNP